ncbi:MAG: amidase, partial [Proteobacteria bacterium]|nr:amidase [Pseudomonadota bacterium]
MTIGELSSKSAHALARLVRERKASPVDVVEDTLAHIALIEPKLNAFAVLDADGARSTAKSLEAKLARGETLGPLAGVPVTIKDIAAVKGLPTRKGSRLSDPTPASTDAVMVERLKNAGAIIVGKTTMPEQGWIATSDSPLTGATHNPWKHGHTAGGSSSGAAALAAAGCMPLHQGSDGAGSVRLPAHFCGVVGLKPTFGTVPYTPAPNNNALSHVGPITRTVEDARLMLTVIAGPDPSDPLSHPL